MYPTFNGTRTSEGYENPPSTVHIVNGAGGNQESPSIYSSTYPLGQVSSQQNFHDSNWKCL